MDGTQMRALILALALLLFASPAFAQAQKPNGVNLPQTVVPIYNLTVSVWAYATGVGNGVGIFEQHSDGQWYGCRFNPQPDFQFDQSVSAAGGAQGYLTKALPGLNDALAKCYPSIGNTGPGPGASNLEILNYLLSGYAFKVVNGLEVLGVK